MGSYKSLFISFFFLEVIHQINFTLIVLLFPIKKKNGGLYNAFVINVTHYLGLISHHPFEIIRLLIKKKKAKCMDVHTCMRE